MARRKLRLGLLTGGGDGPGLNAVIRAVVKKGIRDLGASFVGILDGFVGLVERRWRPLTFDTVSGILHNAGTILGTSNKGDPLAYGDRGNVMPVVLRHLRELRLDGLICLGGDGTMRIAQGLSRRWNRVVGIPKTIDNDVAGTEITFGFDTAAKVAADAVQILAATADAHRRVMVVEVMGRTAGWIALHAGIAGGADVILIPEIRGSMSKVAEFIRRRHKTRRFTLVVVAEGAAPEGIDRASLHPGIIGTTVADRIEDAGFEARVTILGHLQRSAPPTPADRVLATRFGAAAVDLVADRKFGRMTAVRGGRITSLPLARVAGRVKLVPRDHELVRAARSLGTSFGDEGVL
ncbi:MAG TPA: ATP-dependent 6-phosphofructokinase [Planctomycetota bacterium]|nr:ATP-dependent 6-phosphofructokinase [Planctomycetota bacterium]